MRAWVAHGVLVVVVRQVHIVCIAAPSKLQRRDTRLRNKAPSNNLNLLQQASHVRLSLFVLPRRTVQDCAIMTHEK